MLKITCDFEDKPFERARLGNGEIVYMEGDKGTSSFYGICVHDIGVIELNNGSTGYCSTKEQLYVGSKISYWTLKRVFRNSELILRD